MLANIPGLLKVAFSDHYSVKEVGARLKCAPEDVPIYLLAGRRSFM